MARLSDDELNHIRSSVDIVDTISSYLPLTQRGKNYFGVCPFHDDNNPSMSVSKERQIYTCFSCGATGNVFKFIMDYEHISFIEAVKKVADMGGVPVHIEIGAKKTEKDQALYDIYEISQKFYQNNINTASGKEAKDYLLKREIDETIIREFGIGLSLKKRDLLTKLLEKKGFSNQQLEKSGLVSKQDYGYCDIYYDRVMFPLWDLNGKVVGFSGRIYSGSDTAKYINTRETEIFKKGEMLYNYHRAREEARRSDCIVIMEGFMDVIRAYTIGVSYVVATMGTAVTKNQANLIKRMAKNVILCFDGDSAGAKATFACSKELTDIGVIPKIVRLEDNMDPDDYIKKNGKEAFLEKLASPITVMDFKIGYYKEGKDLSDPEDLAQYVNLLIKELQSIDDEILRELTLKKISEEARLDIEFLRGKLGNRPVMKAIAKAPQRKVKKGLSKYEKAEQYLLFYMLKNSDIIAMYNHKGSYLPTDRFRKLVREITCYYKNKGTFELADFITYLGDNPILLSALGEIESLPLKEQYSPEEIEDYFKVLREYTVNFEWDMLNEQMKRETDRDLRRELAQKMLELKLRRDEYVQ